MHYKAKNDGVIAVSLQKNIRNLSCFLANSWQFCWLLTIIILNFLVNGRLCTSRMPS